MIFSVDKSKWLWYIISTSFTKFKSGGLEMKKILLIGSFVVIALVCCIGAIIRCSAGKVRSEPEMAEGIEEA